MTQKTKSQLDSLFANNTTGLTTNASLRDFVDTATHGHGSFYISASSATTITVPGTYYKMAGSTSLVAGHRFTMPTNNRLTYTGSASVHAHLVVNLSVLSSVNNQVCRYAIAINGIILDHSIMETKVLTGTDIDSIAIHADATLATNDYIELWCTNATSTSTITAERAYLYAMAMLRDDA